VVVAKKKWKQVSLPPPTPSAREAAQQPPRGRITYCNFKPPKRRVICQVDVCDKDNFLSRRTGGSLRTTRPAKNHPMALSVSSHPRNAGQLLQTQSEPHVLSRAIPATRGNCFGHNPSLASYFGPFLGRGATSVAPCRDRSGTTLQSSYFSLQDRHRVYMRLSPLLSAFRPLRPEALSTQDRHRFYMHAGPASANRVPSCFLSGLCQLLAVLISCN